MATRKPRGPYEFHVSFEHEGKTYTGRGSFSGGSSGMLTVVSDAGGSKSTQLGGSSLPVLAERLLRELTIGRSGPKPD